MCVDVVYCRAIPSCNSQSRNSMQSFNRWLTKRMLVYERFDSPKWWTNREMCKAVQLFQSRLSSAAAITSFDTLGMFLTLQAKKKQMKIKARSIDSTQCRIHFTDATPSVEAPGARHNGRYFFLYHKHLYSGAHPDPLLTKHIWPRGTTVWYTLVPI